MKRRGKIAVSAILVLVLCLQMLTGCRSSSALTRLENASRALNMTDDQMLTEEEEEEEHPDKQEPSEEHRDDGLLEEEETTVGQLMEEVFGSEESAQEALQSIYSDLAEQDWGIQYITDVLEEQGVSPNQTSTPVASATTTNGATEQTVASDNAEDNAESDVLAPGSFGDTLTDESESAGGSMDEDTDETQGTGDDAGGENEGTIIEPDDTEGEDTGGGSADSGKEAIDPDGEYTEKEPTGAGKVAAAGQMAILVSMLAGGDVLCATSEDYAENELAQKAFGGDYEVLWDGDGSSPMSSENFALLLEMQPAWCIEVSGSETFSSSQVAQLEEAGIGYAALPGFSSDAYIRETVETLANEVLGDMTETGGKNAPKVASEYLDFCDELQKEVSGYSQSELVYVEGWDPDVSYTFTFYKIKSPMEYTSATTDGGAAYIRVGTGFRPLSDYLAYANVTDYASEPNNGGNNLGGDVYSWDSRWSGNTAAGTLCYITPIKGEWGLYSDAETADFAWSVFAYGISGYALSTYTVWAGLSHGLLSSSSIQMLQVASITGTTLGATFGSVLGLGSSDGNFRTVLVPDQETKEALESSWSWQPGAGTYGVTSALLRQVSGADGSWALLQTHIQGDYDIYVNPTGLGDWVNGSPESILESVWIAWKLQGYSLNKAENTIRNFYSHFYGYSMSTEEMEAMFFYS